MTDRAGYEVVQGESGWVLKKSGLVPLVEFPTRRQAVRAAIAVCQDEGLGRLVIRRADGRVEIVDPLGQALDAIEV